MRRKDREEYTQKSKKLQEFMTEVAEEVGRRSGFVQRQSKMTAEVFAETLIFGGLDNPEAPLNELVQVSEDLGVTISEEGLHQRMNERAVAFLRDLLASSLKQFKAQGTIPDEVLNQFTSMNLLDSTQVTLPEELAEFFAGFNSEGSRAMLKMQLSIDYLTGRLNAIRFGAGRDPDQNCDLAEQVAKEGSLEVFDMGYGSLERLDRLANLIKAYFLTRFKSGTNVYASASAEKPLDLVDWLDAQGDTVDQNVFLGATKRLRVRLVAQRLPDHVVAERRRKARRNAKKKGRTVSQRHLRLLAWTICITNVPPDMLTAEQVMIIYRLRWQIELFFKLCKSQFRLAAIGPWRLDRILCHLFARLIAIVFFQWLIAPWRFLDDAELSPTKAWRVVRRASRSLLDAIRTRDLDELTALLLSITDDFLRYALKNSRVKSPSTLARL